MSTTQYRIDDDGVTHCNVYSLGKTELGRALSNFSAYGIKHPEHGFFASLEAFWYYVKTGYQHEQLRRLYGASAKSTGSKLPPVWMDAEAFRDEIRRAITMKVEQHPDLLDALLHNTLPLTHYYVVGRGEQRLKVEKPEHQWQLDHLQHLVLKWSKPHPDE